MKTSCVHFVGFRTGQEYWSAVRVWGKPDFIHMTHDHRMYGDVDMQQDTIIFGSKASPDKIDKYSWQDHQNW